ncbi:unnamed protein product [Cuscuta campestris]|uniref:Major facilitator superfamily (MFS) profile domain-containing protein n=1 Tax=Cuscuta campestris TaxID=132261 RepID=A0A484K9P6_9ASTE|nr:unnamed protein product [Cuscuta campestris]
MERFTFKGVAANMMSYLTDVVKMSNSSAAKMVNNWCGLTYLVPLLVAPLADSFLDRYSIILLSSLPYLLGLFALTSRAFRWPWRARTNTSTASTLLGWSLALISLGLGVYTASLQAFGADQLDYDHDDDTDQEDPGGGEESSDRRSRFFQRWYFGICCGCLLGVVGMSYIQDTVGWGLGFAIPSFVMVASVALFLSGTRFYRFKKTGVESNHLIQAIKGRVASRLKNRGGDSLPAEKSEVVVVVELHEQISSPLYDEDSNGGKKQNDDMNPLDLVKLVIRLLPTWMTLLMFAVIFQQPATFFTRQGMTMERNIIGTKIKVPPAALQSAIAVSVILLMPLYHKAFIPSIRAFTRNEKGVTVRQRMGIGMFLSVVAMVVAAVTERRRLCVSNRQTEDVHGDNVVPMSIFWLLPQYILLGVSDIFTVVGMQEFFYSAVPENMRTFGVALNTSVFGVGNFLGSALIAAIEHLTGSRSAGERRSWFSNDLREARLDYYYWFLASSSGISLAAFILFCKLVRVR